MQDRVTLKTSTILISAGAGGLQSFRALKDIPDDLRNRLVRSTAGPYSATLLIADERGRQELLQSLRGQPSALESSSMRSFQNVTPVLDNAPATGRLDARPEQSERALRWRRVAEISLLAGIGLCLWLLAAWR